MMLPDFSAVRVMIAGDAMVDRYWFGDVERISPEAPVPVVAVRTVESRPGGAANVAANVQALGALTHVVSIVGEDEAGRTLQQLCSSRGIEADWIVDRKCGTTVKLRVISQNQQLLRTDFDAAHGDSALREYADRCRQMALRSDVVVISDYGKGSLAEVENLIAGAVAAGKIVIVDPKGTDFARYRLATVVTPNLREFEAVAGRCANDADRHARALDMVSRFQFGSLLLTRSGAGMTMYYPDGTRFDSPARAQEVYDVSGAGDTVVAALAATKGAGLDDHVSLGIANAAAGIVVGKLGTAAPTRSEIESVLRETRT